MGATLIDKYDAAAVIDLQIDNAMISDPSDTTSDVCLYCLGDLSSRPRSLEHIIQHSIGGSAEFGTRNCWKDCNDRLGSTIDAPFVNKPPMALLRTAHGLRSQSGKEPFLTVKGTAGADDSVPAQITFGHNSLKPTFKTVVSETGQTTQISGDADTVRRILQGKIDAARAKGMRLLLKDGTPITDVDIGMAGAKTTALRDFTAQFGFDPASYGLGLIKIAYGSAYLFQGPAWLKTPMASRLRTILQNPASLTHQNQIDDLLSACPD